MKRVIKTVYTGVSTACIALACTFGAVATEQAEPSASRMARAMDIMDIVQKVSLWVLIIVISLVAVWYLAKMILRHIHVPPEQTDDAKENEEE